jgi:acetyl/propionyl-CoA carboxylase alpha subunit
VAPRTVLLNAGGREHKAEIRDERRVVVEGQTLDVRSHGRGEFRIESSGTVAWAVADGDTRWVFADGRTHVLTAGRAAVPSRRRGAQHGALTAPMPGTIKRVQVVEGQRVAKGETLIVLEAMKMELPVRAARDGTVARVACREGELVQPGVALIEMEE